MSGGHVLVVDDAAFNRRLLARLLEGIGHTVIEAGDGRAALDLLAGEAGASVDVVLLDIVMPVLDGFATLEAMQADERLRELPVIVISDLDDSASIVRCIRMGAADHLPKTVDPEILRARIEASLARKRLRDLERDSMAEQARLLGTIERQKTELSRFLSPQVAALVSSDDGDALLAGHRREITAMFCDLRQFTVFSDAAEPEEVLGFLRAYHGLMGPLIVAHEGTLEHFAGDGFMTFFNDPVAAARPCPRGRSAWPRPCARDSWSCATSGGGAGYTLELGIGIATGYATLGASASRAATTTAAWAGHHPRRAAERRCGPGEILIAQGTYAAAGRGHRGRTRRRAPAQGLQPADADLRGPGRSRTGGPAMTDPAIDPEAFARLADITGDDPAFLAELVDTYLEDGAAQVAALRAAADRRRSWRPGPAGPHPQVEQCQHRRDGPGRAVPDAGGGCPQGVVPDAGAACDAIAAGLRGGPPRRSGSADRVEPDRRDRSGPPATSRRRRAMSECPAASATSAGVRPASVVASGSAPADRNSSTSSTSPLAATSWSGA